MPIKRWNGSGWTLLYPDPSTTNAANSLVQRDGSGNYTAPFATQLATARTINGVSFNGTANITITAVPNDASVTNAKLSTTAGQPGGAWQTFTPNITAGTHTGAKTGRYIQIGKTVEFLMTITWASGSNFSGLKVNLPVTAQANVNQAQFTVIYADGFDQYSGFMLVSTTEIATFYGSRADGTYTRAINGTHNISNTIPFTWAAGDTIQIYGRYEAA